MLTKKKTISRKRSPFSRMTTFDLAFKLRNDIRSEYDVYPKYDPDTRHFNYCFAVHIVANRIRNKR